MKFFDFRAGSCKFVIFSCHRLYPILYLALSPIPRFFEMPATTFPKMSRRFLVLYLCWDQKLLKLYIYLLLEMGKYLKYLLPLMMVLAFWNCTDESGSAVDGKEYQIISFNETDWHSNISEPESELCLPRQVSYANSHKVQNTARRTTGAGRSNIEFAKSGKIINAYIRYSIQRKSITTHSSLAESSHRLFYLGKLII